MAWPGPRIPHYAKSEIKGIKDEISDIARAVSHYAPVSLLVNTAAINEAQKAFQDAGKHGVSIAGTDKDDLEPWMRDIAPTFVVGEGVHGIDFNFNGWGGKYPSKNNASLAQEILAAREIPRVQTDLVLEGGALEVDGEGTLLVTESSILNPNRNATLSREHVETELFRLLGVSKIIWLPGVRDAEVTDAHIDSWVRFIAPGKLLLNDPGPGKGVDSEVFQTNKRILAQETDAQGRRFELLSLREAEPQQGDDEPDLCLSYVNYLLVNRAVIAPRFGDHAADQHALSVLKAAFPGREVVQVGLEYLALIGGGVHCVTQQIPL